MDRIVVAAAIGMGLVFVTGIIVGIVLMVTMAIRSEDRRKTLTQEPGRSRSEAARDANRHGKSSLPV